jgi:uncharacterized protein (DUF2384 family)
MVKDVVRTAWRPRERAEFVIAQLGGPRAAARTLGVAASQPSRWASGESTPGPQQARLLADLDHAFAVALQVWHPDVARDWMTTANAFLDGARPLDVIRSRGSGDVVQALRAESSGAFA